MNAHLARVSKMSQGRGLKLGASVESHGESLLCGNLCGF